MRSILSAVLVMASSAALAQQAPLEQQRCWLAGKGYSPGATVRAGETVMTCSPAFVWEATKAAASGCIFNGEFYGTAAIEGDKEAPKNQCQPDGTWKWIEAQ